MCGIAGKLNFDRARQVEPDLLARMNAVMAHRGPDDAGVYCAGPVGLAHRRLSIIDLSPAGHQPMSNEDGTIWITFNGEIYNFPDLREDLIRRGHRFRSKTDTETVLHLYEEDGPACVRALRGMFAFAIWDGRTRTMLLARDRLGKKPLYYQIDHRGLRFASEIKAILLDPEVEVTPDAEAIHHYLSFGYVPHPGTAYCGIRTLPPAHVATLRDGQLTLERYWRLRYGAKHPGTEADLARELLRRLEEAVRIRMISDVPLGAFLSGGIDSSAVVAMMSRHAAEPVRTFSIGFEAAEYDERRYARLIAERFGTRHEEFVVRPDAAGILPTLVWHYDQPYADSSAIPTYYVAQVTRQHVTVALNGDGGDEGFAGYERYVAQRLAGRLDWLPAAARRRLRAALGLVPRGVRRGSLLARGRRFLDGLLQPPDRRYSRWVFHFTADRKAELYQPDFAAAVSAPESEELLVRAFQTSDGLNMVDALLDVDTRTYLPDDLLVKVDVASMAHALEARSPFLDHELLEFAAGVPSHLKLRGTEKKVLLRRALRGILPDAVLDRPKMGFGVPIDRWFRDELRPLAYDTLLSRRAADRGYFRPEVVRAYLDEHVRGQAHWHYLLWNLLMLELWHCTFIDGDGRLAQQRRNSPAAVKG
ncbi:MAG: asparagine synthase (glutamine-hydrolyzing) [candidate division NC10 bacterium]|nr:asparagine synthase (glutamine-hydrolyzing) [candidate division NC10 bacterium]